MAQKLIHDRPHDLRDLIQSALARNPSLTTRNVRFELHEEDVVLRGIVRTYYQKQLAQESLRSIDGINRVRNELEVVTS